MGIIEQIRIEELRKEELAQASDVLGKAFAAQPGSLAIYLDKSDVARRMQIVFVAILEHLPGKMRFEETTLASSSTWCHA
jgi:hypothetical protein